METEFYISCVPPKATHQASATILKRPDGTPFVGKMQTSKGKAAQRNLLALLREHAPASPVTGPLALNVVWCYPWRKSEPKKNRIAGFKPCDTRPDVDNLAKMLLDVMSGPGGFWNDDSQIAVLTFSKFWGDLPGIGIRYKTLGPPELAAGRLKEPTGHRLQPVPATPDNPTQTRKD